MGLLETLRSYLVCLSVKRAHLGSIVDHVVWLRRLETVRQDFFVAMAKHRQLHHRVPQVHIVLRGELMCCNVDDVLYCVATLVD